MTHRYRSPTSPFHGLSLPEIIDKKRTSRMSQIDGMPPDIRALIHDYGLSAVKAIMDCGVRRPKQIKHIIETILNEFSPTRGTFSQQGVRGPTLKSCGDDPRRCT